MRLTGNYAFEKLRQCLQGVFEFYTTQDDNTTCYILELWQIRFFIRPNSYVELYINMGENKGYVKIGKFLLSE